MIGTTIQQFSGGVTGEVVPASNTIEYHTKKEFISHLDLLPCGCLDNSAANMSTLRESNADVYCCYYTPCGCAEPDLGSYKVFPENNLMQFNYGFGFNNVYVEYYGNMPRIDGQLQVPEVAFETLVNKVKWMAVDGKSNVSNPDKRYRFEVYQNARRNMDRERSQVSLDHLMDAVLKAPKFSVNYSTWRHQFDWQAQLAEAVPAAQVPEICDTTNTGGGGTTTVTVINNVPDPTPPSIIVSGNELNSTNSYLNPVYASYDLLLFWNGIRYLLPQEYLILPGGGVTILMNQQFTAEDKFIIIPNGKR